MTDQYTLITDDPKLKRRTEHLTKRASVAIRRIAASRGQPSPRTGCAQPSGGDKRKACRGHTSATPPGMIWGDHKHRPATRPAVGPPAGFDPATSHGPRSRRNMQRRRWFKPHPRESLGGAS
jgi:hypothetical protein